MWLKAIFSYVGPDLESSLLHFKNTYTEQVNYIIKRLDTLRRVPHGAFLI